MSKEIKVGKDGRESQEERIEKILKTSFLAPYLEEDSGITDISYNGTDLRLQHNIEGVLYPDRQPTLEEVEILTKQISDVTRKNITNSEPLLNTEIGILRVNAVHESVSPEGRTFALRVSRPRLAISSLKEMTIGESQEVGDLLKVLIKSESNIILSGRTGTGKTELQKLLVGYIPDDHKIVLIEDTRDSHIKTLYPKKDIVSWQTVESSERENSIGYHELIVESLRNNPEWILVSEVRGSEAADMLDGVKTGHSIITTLHATGAMNIPSRLIPMIRQSQTYTNMSDRIIGNEIVEFLRFGIHLEAKNEGNGIVRRIKEIVEYTDFGDKGVVGKYIYRYRNVYNPETGEYEMKEEFNSLSSETIAKIEDMKLLHMLPKTFIEEATV